MRRALLFLLCASLLLPGCTGVFYDGENKIEIGSENQRDFLKVQQEAPPAEEPDKATLIKAYREYIISDPDMLEETKKPLLEILDKLEAGDHPNEQLEEMMLQAVKNAIEADKSRLKENAESLKYVQQALADIIYEDHKKLLIYYDEAVKLREKLQNARKACDVTYEEYHRIKNTEFKSFGEENEYTLSKKFCDAADYAQKNIEISVVGYANYENYNLFRLAFLRDYNLGATWEKDESYSKNRMRDWNNQLYYQQIPAIIKEIKRNTEDYKKTINNTIELLRLYLFFYDESKCANHIDPYHYYDSYFSFENSGIFQEALRNKLASYSGKHGDELLRYEDDNIINFIGFSKISSDYYEKEYFWDGNRPEGDNDIKNNPQKYGLSADDTAEVINDRKIRRSSASLLLPVFMIFSDLKGPLSCYDGGSAVGYNGSISYGYTWKDIQEFFNGAELTSNRYGETVAGYKITDYCKKYTKKDKIKYNGKELTFAQYYKERYENKFKQRNTPVYGSDTLCGKHLTSYHTIGTELLDYLKESGRSITEFQSKNTGESFNIRNFVKFYNISEEKFRELFDPDKRSFQPYNIAAVYGKDELAANYFSLEYRTGYEVSYNMNGVPASGAFTTNVQPGVQYTIPQRPSCPGYVFVHWTTTQNGSGKRYQPYEIVTMENKNVVYYAQWQRNSFEVTYDLNGGGGTTPESVTYYVGDVFKVPKSDGIIPPEGKALSGWSTNPGNPTDIAEPDGLFTMPADDITLYAVWADKYWDVSFDLQGGSATPMPYQTPLRRYETFTLPEVQNPVPPQSMRPNNAKVGEWNTAQDGSGERLLPGDTVVMPDESLHLYANWMIVHRVTFNPNGGRLLRDDLDLEGIQHTVGTTPTAEDVEPPPDDPETGDYYELVWWRTANGRYTFSPGDYVSCSENIEFYAVWERKSRK